MDRVDDWSSYEELAWLLGEQVERSTASAYPVGATSQELDFSWLVVDDEGEGNGMHTDDLLSASPVSVESTDAREADKALPTPEDGLDFEDRDSTLPDEGIREALHQNKACQALIKTVMEAVEQELASTQDAIRQLREVQSNDPILSKEFTALLANPFAVILKAHEAGKLELGEAQRQTYCALQQEHRLKSKTWKWTKAQRRQLALGVRQQNQKMLLEKVMADREMASRSLDQIQKELNAIKCMDQRALELNLEGVDYDKISRLFVPKKSAMDCELQWRHQDHPLLNTSDKWTSHELDLLKEHGECGASASWTEIAATMGTHRSPFACVVEYQRRFKPHLNKGKWTADEDAALKDAVARFGDAEWSRIAASVPGRDRLQCLHRWHKTLSPSIRKGKWSKEEDEALRQAVKDHPDGSWKRISACIPGRTDVKCRERWTNVLDPSLKRTKFTSREDRVLVAAVQDLGQGKWSAVAARLSGRTDNQCLRRWKQLMRNKKR